MLGLPRTILPGNGHWDLLGQCWSWFGGGGRFRGRSDLVWCGKDFDEQNLEVILGFFGLGITMTTKRGMRTRNDG